MNEAKITLITSGKDGLQRVEIREPFDPMELDEFCVSLAEAWTGAIDAVGHVHSAAGELVKSGSLLSPGLANRGGGLIAC